jgi:diguanylate cyclase (GGDEF)-like protein/PAS domain S-box-containing protein
MRLDRLARRPFFRSIMPATAATLLCGLLVTLLLSAGVLKLEQDRARLNFEQHAGARIAAITKSFSDALDALNAVNLLFMASDDVDRASFEAFAQPLIDRNPYVQALVFHRFVQGRQRAAFEAERRQLFPDFQITERENGGLRRAATRELYLVDDFVVPMRSNLMTLGYDTWSHPPQRETAQRAIDTGLPTAGVLRPLLQGTVRGMVIVMPVYRHGVPLTDVAARRRAAIGDTEVVIDPEQLIGRNLKDAGLLDTPGIALDVLGAGPGNIPQLAYRHQNVAPDGVAARWWTRWPVDATFSRTRQLEIAGKIWTVIVSAPQAAMASYLGSVATFALGLILSVLIAALTQARAVRTKRIDQLVTERTADLKRASDALRLHRRAIESSANAIVILSAAGPDFPIEYVNPAFERISGYTADEMLGRGALALCDSDQEQPAIQELHSAIRERREGHALVRHFHKDGSVMFSDMYIAPVTDKSGVAEHFVVSQYDVTMAKAYEEELEHRAKYDTLTGLPNRSLLYDRLQQAKAFASARSVPVWAVTLGLDRFKFINDTLGRQGGNELLRVVAARIVAALGPTDTVARIGGDEFVLVLTDRDSERQATGMVQAVMDSIAMPVTIQGHPLVVTCSAGVAVYPADGSDTETLLKHAEIAMYRAKESGRNATRFYTARMNDRALERLAMEGELRHALERGEFELHYQPQVALADGRIVGMEALLRWRNPRFGMVRPDRFIGLAEDTGLIVPIGAWVLGTACAQAKAWQHAGYGALRVAVNLSARQFWEKNLARSVLDTLEATGLAPTCLEIEVTESLLMKNVDQAVGTMRELRALGIMVSIDDFGTGYSSLSYLKSFPVDVLKIDQSFVRDITAHPDHAAIVGGIIQLAHSLRLKVIAEGVETEKQLDFLRSRACDEIQGNLFSLPLPAIEFEQLLREGRSIELNPGAAAGGRNLHRMMPLVK